MKVLYWDKAGPLIDYELGFFVAESLNPQTKLAFRLSRRDAFIVGVKLAWRAVTGKVAK